VIVASICSCGKRYTPETWAGLPLKGMQDTGIDGELLALRNCPCGSTRTMPEHEDVICKQIRKVRGAMRVAIAQARLELACLRADVAIDGTKPSFLNVRADRQNARVLRLEQRRLEGLLEKIWRARELADPAKRVGRNISLVVDAGADERAKTDPPAAAEGST